ncbi:ATP-binding protein [Ilumatobacter sp.]|uniref:ATP-binding protein n=1 Tax=Ilumatobacter sp. TaxID=1967498 RepID=UPI003B51C4C0
MTRTAARPEPIVADGDDDDWFCLELPPLAVAATVARSAIRRVFTFDDPDRESSFLVALTEIVTNAIDEHRVHAPDRAVVVEVGLGRFPEVRVIDEGRGLDLTDTDDVAGEGPAPTDQTGRGLALARAFVPSLSFVTSPNGTTAILPLDGFGSPR